ncbi:hypothetical protein PcaKH16_19120 [Parageobacillus caldoxylosilyticus]|nr:hypothetical protein PcaKH16_19120 [Parageobacillus caldoxylosilyticus]
MPERYQRLIRLWDWTRRYTWDGLADKLSKRQAMRGGMKLFMRLRGDWDADEFSIYKRVS